MRSRSPSATTASSSRPATARALLKLRLNVAAPAPNDPAKRARMTELQAQLDSQVRRGQVLPQGSPSPAAISTSSRKCSPRAATTRSSPRPGRAGTTSARAMRADYTEFVALANEGARDTRLQGPRRHVARQLRHAAGRVRCGVRAAVAAGEAAVRTRLQCYARGRLAKHYGEDKVPAGKPIPAQLLGNMWAQQWNKIYDDLLKPYPNASIETADAMLQGAEVGRGAHDALGGEPSTPRWALRPCRKTLLGALDARRARATARSCATRAPGT